MEQEEDVVVYCATVHCVFNSCLEFGCVHKAGLEGCIYNMVYDVSIVPGCVYTRLGW